MRGGKAISGVSEEKKKKKKPESLINKVAQETGALSSIAAENDNRGDLELHY